MNMKQIIPIVLLAGLIVLAVAGQSHAGSFEGRVIGIADGDTITVLTPQKKQVKIRLYGIDTPGRQTELRHQGEAIHQRTGF